MMTMRVAEKNRLGRATDVVRPSIQAHITWLEQELKDLDDGLRQTLRQSPVWREKDDLPRSVPGVGERLSRSLLVYLPELGALDRKRIAALVGVAPLNRDSGTMRGKRTVWGGRARVRAVLYMAALVATRYNPVIRTFYPTVAGGGRAQAAGAHRVYAEVADRAHRPGAQADTPRREPGAVSGQSTRPVASG